MAIKGILVSLVQKPVGVLLERLLPGGLTVRKLYLSELLNLVLEVDLGPGLAASG